MALDPSPTLSAVLTAVSAVGAGISVTCAVLNYRLNRKIHLEAKVDERLAFGTPYRPDLRVRDHSQSVICLEVFNTSKRKAYIDSVVAYDSKSRDVPIEWSGAIDELGMPQNPSGILAVTDTSTICIRRIDGEEFEFARITFKHSLSDVRSIVIFDEFASFVRTEKARASAG